MTLMRRVVLGMIVTASVLAACTAPATTVSPTAAPTKPTVPTATTPAGPSPPGATSIAAEALLHERCTTCHNLDRVKATRKSAEDWKASVQRMVSKGARLSADEVDALVTYLAATYK